MPAVPPPPERDAEVDAAAFRNVIGRFATGVTVVTAHADGVDHGLTASAVSSLSLAPPMLLVCINRAAATHEAVRRSGAFAVNVLSEDQASLARRFATPLADKFAGVATRRGTLGPRLLDDALATIECRVAEAVVAGTHSIVLGRVVHATARDGAPLAYFRGQFGQLQLARDDLAYGALRERVLSGQSTGRLDPDALAATLHVDVGRVDRALAQLAGEGLVAGDPVDGYVVLDVTRAVVDDALDARCAIEIGAVRTGLAEAAEVDVAAIARAAAGTAALVAEGRVDDLAAYARANAAFHEALVRLPGSRTLLDAYRRLQLPGILVRGLGAGTALSGEHVEDHLAIAAACAARDADEAAAAIRRHTERAKATHAAPGTTTA